jgi:predicted transcriptional regulator of viral defense system
MEDQPITPHAGPAFDPEGNLTYVGDDGRRYVVAAMPDADEQQVDQVMERLRRGNALFNRLELLAREWLHQVSGDELDHRAALALLLTTLETALDDDPTTDAD